MFARKWLVVSFLLSFIVSGFILSDKKASADWSFDNTGPNVWITVGCGSNYRDAVNSSTSPVCTGDSATVTFYCSDEVTGCKEITPKIRNVDQTTTSFTAEAITNRSVSYTVYRADGSAVLGARAKDAAGNLGNASTVTVNWATCNISLGLDSSSIQATQDTAARASLTSGYLDSVSFVSGTTSVATVSPATDSDSGGGYYTMVTGVTTGTSVITATGTIGTRTCLSTTEITITSACTISSVTLGASSIREDTTTTATPVFTAGSIVDRVDFSSSDTAKATLSPIRVDSASASSPPSTTVTGANRGTATITATGYKGGVARCSGTSPTITITPACTISFVNNSIAIEKGDSGTAIATTDHIVDSVSVSSSNTNIATVGVITGPTGTGPYSYSALINGMGTGTADLTGRGVIGGNTRCTTQSPATVSVSVPHAWWQVMDMDVFSPGALTSVIPISCRLPNCNPNFNLPGPGGYPGVSTYRTNFGFGRGGVAASPFSWIANSWYTGRIYDYGWFKKQVPPEVFTDERAKITATMMPGQYLPSNGYIYDGVIWKYYSGCCFYIMDSDVVLGNNKMVLFVDGDLYISKRINFTKGSGFFAAIVSGNIYIDPSVTQSDSATDFALEGLYLVNGSFNTAQSNSATGSDKKLKIRGAVVAWNGVGLQRDLVGGNDTTPAEYIEYAPDLMFTFPRELSRRGVIQKEVAP